MTTESLVETVRVALKPFANRPIVAAISGGVDSMSLLLLLSELRKDTAMQLHVCHVHHGLRDMEADRDELFVTSVASRLDIPFISMRVNVTQARSVSGESEEMAARRLRYNALQTVADELGVCVVVTAHHQLDQAETVLERVIRGTGIAGLAGMPYMRPLGVHTLLRPLLTVTKEKMIAFMKQTGETFVQDSTNSSMQYVRNRVRLDLLPQLSERYNPQIIEALIRLAELARADNEALNALAKEAEAALVRYEGSAEHRVAYIERASFVALACALQRRIITLVLAYAEPDVSWPYARIEAVRHFVVGADGNHTALEIGRGWSAAKRLSEIKVLRSDRLQQRLSGWIPWAVPEEGGVFSLLGARLRITVQVTAVPFVWPPSLWECYVARTADALQFRPWRAGDRIKPRGMGGRSKLVSDVLTDAKAPREERAQYPLLCKGDEVLWVPGYCRSHLASVEAGVADQWHFVAQRRE